MVLRLVRVGGAATALLGERAIPETISYPCSTDRSQTVCEAFEAVCRKNKKFLDDVLAGSRLMSAVDDMREIERAARDFLQHRIDVKSARVEALCNGESLPLFAGEEPDEADTN